ncbi:helix-turn-helix domain-containing protein [Phenylobacterium sp. SCN 70-31]|uniref:MerR family transcriptional regulator n=1 Tax=Phenylobacterium sp. SCN 70-31 TaxID=1660129 RepID=UPI00086A0BEF|nr:helix-turn-helix domain-containing protein [Phenylobacterium sp. SCN 70-31]ODT89419.1 MAG: transcriptional regulator [Phenylobacterium sp. SCN 70-31]
MTSLSIGRLARATDVKVPTIRFYEQIGLLPEPERTQSDRRLYGEADVRRLAFIKHARQLGFAVEAIRSLLALADDPDRPCAEANALAAEQLAVVETKIERLQALRHELRRMARADCDGRAGDCRVIEALGDHSLCADDHDRPATPGALGAL